MHVLIQISMEQAVIMTLLKVFASHTLFITNVNCYHIKKLICTFTLIQDTKYLINKPASSNRISTLHMINPIESVLFYLIHNTLVQHLE